MNSAVGHKGFTAAPLQERFEAKAPIGHDDECWPWLGAKRRGYGLIWADGRKRPAHQVAWELANGEPFPTGMHACHTCDNPSCVNPAHIFPGTRSDNLRDAVRKGRMWQQRDKADRVDALIETEGLWAGNFCECGCGEELPIMAEHGGRRRFVHGHNLASSSAAAPSVKGDRDA